MTNETKELASQIAGFPAFATCTKSDLRALAEAGTGFTLPAGWPLVQEGVPADACYVLTQGSALVFVDREEVAKVGVGDVIGEVTLLAGGQRRATVTSDARVAGLRIDNAALRPLSSQRPSLAKAFHAVYEVSSDDRTSDDRTGVGRRGLTLKFPGRNSVPSSGLVGPAGRHRRQFHAEFVVAV